MHPNDNFTTISILKIIIFIIEGKVIPHSSFPYVFLTDIKNDTFFTYVPHYLLN